MTTDEVAFALNVSSGTVRRWANDPDEALDRVYLGKHKRTVRFRPQQVEEYAKGLGITPREKTPDS